MSVLLYILVLDVLTSLMILMVISFFIPFKLGVILLLVLKLFLFFLTLLKIIHNYSLIYFELFLYYQIEEFLVDLFYELLDELERIDLNDLKMITRFI